MLSEAIEHISRRLLRRRQPSIEQADAPVKKDVPLHTIEERRLLNNLKKQLAHREGQPLEQVFNRSMQSYIAAYEDMLTMQDRYEQLWYKNQSGEVPDAYADEVFSDAVGELEKARQAEEAAWEAVLAACNAWHEANLNKTDEVFASLANMRGVVREGPEEQYQEVAPEGRTTPQKRAAV